MVLSLVILVIITSNVILWSYQMNQLDWERIQENVEVKQVTRVRSSAWSPAENEYLLRSGSLVNGTYHCTTAVDELYETFREANQATLHADGLGHYAEWGNAVPSGVAHWDCCDENPPDDDGTYVQTTSSSWQQEAYNLKDPGNYGGIVWVRVYMRAKISSVGVSQYIRTLIRTYDTDFVSGDIALTSSYQDLYTQYAVNPFTGAPWTWDEVTSLQAGASGRSFGSQHTRLTAVWAVVNYNGQSVEIDGTFVMDLSVYPLDHVKGAEVQLRYRANDVGEKWYLKALNWTSGSYSDSGFNSTMGHMPTTGWDYYAVSMSDQWRNYVRADGVVSIKLVDSGTDSNQTTIDIDFLAVRVLVEGTQFFLSNQGASTCHIVSIWVTNNSLHERFEADVHVNSGESLNYTRVDIKLPSSPFIVKVVTERGNIAVYSQNWDS